MNDQTLPGRILSSRTPVDLQQLGMFLSSIGSFNPALIYGSRVHGRLYHYTDLPGLLGIVSNHDLWLTHSLYSNDEEEMNHGMTIVRSVLEEELKAATDVRVESRLKLLAEHFTAAPQGTYVCCFCKTDNLLSQWRGYGANGAGVSVEVDTSGFSVITGPDLPVETFGLLRLWEVFYQRETQVSIVRAAIEFEHAASPQEWADRAAHALEFFLPTFKHGDFSGEEEFRLIFTPATDCPVKPDFRVSRGMVVPYYSLRKLIAQADQLHGGQVDSRLTQLPITQVRVGPSPNKALNTDSIRMFLAKHGYENVDVKQSAIPYRG